MPDNKHLWWWKLATEGSTNMDYFKPTKAINPYGKLSRTIKSQYAKTSTANFIGAGTFGATGAIKKWIKAEKGRNF